MRGDRLRECRLRFGDSQQDLADYLEVTVNTVANWENGRSEPSPRHVSRIGKRYGVSSDYLLGETDDPARYKNLPPGWEQVIEEAARNHVEAEDVLPLIRHIGNMMSKRKAGRD